jgi:argininosuccinate lyase
MGELINVMTTLKGLPLGYNRDLQETKPPAIKVGKDLRLALKVMAVVVDNMSVCPDKMLDAACDPGMMSTDLVEFLVEKGCPFREAHEAVSGLVVFAQKKNVQLSQLSLADFQSFAPQFTQTVFELFDPLGSVKAKRSSGSTAPGSVKSALEKVKIES